MDVFHELPAGEGRGPGSVVTIGTFDGVHAGHQRLLRRVRAAATRRGLRAVAVTFDPHPRCVVGPSVCPPELCSLDDRVALLGRGGADAVVVLRFTLELSRWSAERFSEALVDSLGMRLLVVGPGFALGQGRRGDVAFLRSQGLRLGFALAEVAPATRAGLPVSSGRVRDALVAGRLGEAIAMLGRPYQVEGTVERGEGRGESLGVPTANLAVDPARCLPGPGVYAGWLDAGAGWRMAAAGIGDRPTFGGGAVTVEAHVLDFRGDLYGRSVRLALARRLRSERAFPSAAALSRAMARDIERTRALLAEARVPA